MVQFIQRLDTEHFAESLTSEMGRTRLGVDHNGSRNGIGPSVTITVYSDVTVEDIVRLRDALTVLIDGDKTDDLETPTDE